MEPLVTWPGGKAKLAQAVDLAFAEPCRGVYYEPFLGSGSVFLFRRASGGVRRAVLSDVNPRLINLHRVAAHQPEGLIRALNEVEVSTEWRAVYAEWVRDFNRYQGVPLLGDVDLAVRFLWLNRTCFNGLYRENRQGWFNSPPGTADTPKFPTPERIRTVSGLMRGAQLYIESAFTILAAAGAGDHVYCDPPYVPATPTASFTAYSADRFGVQEQMRLVLEANAAVARGARVVLSNSDVPLVRELYKGWDVHELKVRRSISASAGSRVQAGEVLLVRGGRVTA